MIAQDAAELKEVAAEVTGLRRAQQHGQSILHRTQRVETALSRAQVATATARTLAQRLGDPWVPPATAAAAIAALEEWSTELEGDLDAALGGDLFAKFQDAVEKATRELERRANGAWQRYATQVAPEASPEILAALASDPSARSTVLAIRRLAESIRNLREQPVPTPKDVADFDAAVRDLRTAWATLDVASLNEDVVAFLRAANSDSGAPLSLLTPPVREWLIHRNLESHYSIRPIE